MLGRVLYGLVFVALVPLGLAAWARALEGVTSLPVAHRPLVGAAAAGVGAGLIVWAWRTLWREGRGLPMNAFPPRRRACGGPYAWLAHPIYVGFGIACVGVSLLAGSAAGLWIVSPVVMAAMAALVVGYEADATRERLGPAPATPRLSLAEWSDRPPGPWHRAAIYLVVFVPWCAAYEALGHLPVPGAIEGFMASERGWPVLGWTALVYSGVYPFVLAAPLACQRCSELRRFGEAGLIATLLASIAYLTIPLVSPSRGAAPGGVGGFLLSLERADSLGGRAAFPSFHVAWAVIAACAYGTRGRWCGAAAWAMAIGVAMSCVTTGMHALVDVPAGFLLGILAWRWRSVAAVLTAWAQRVCNSWREWRIGPVRIINHALYAGGAAAVGVLIAGRLAGPAAWAWIAAVSGAAMIGGALWGQTFVKRPTSSRPFGYFGALLGAGAALLVGMRAGVVDWTLVAALAAAAPFVQALGRVRCLVQGCCHGRESASRLAIRYEHPMSRVCRVSGLAGVPVHPTPLYSMLGNLVVGLLLLRLWGVGASAGLIVGGYLILAGLLRFVEEHFRGEPHTPVVAGLRIYQWLAIALVLAGILVCVVRTGAVERAPAAPVSLWLWALGVGAAWGAAMGVDFPRSERRFARLT